jgi:hypothetical protein
LTFFLQDTLYGPQIIGLSPYAFGYINLKNGDLLNRDALFLQRVSGGQSNSKINQKNLEPYFENIRELDPIIVKEKDKVLLEYKVFYCSDYKGNNIR